MPATLTQAHVKTPDLNVVLSEMTRAAFEGADRHLALHPDGST